MSFEYMRPTNSIAQQLCTTMACSSIQPRGMTVLQVSPSGKEAQFLSPSCPSDHFVRSGIPPGQTFIYEIPVNTSGQWGTYWVHAHDHGQYVDGLRAPFLIHPPTEPHKYDDDFTVIVSDWYHQEHGVLLKWFISIANPGGAEPVPGEEPQLSFQIKSLIHCARRGSPHLLREERTISRPQSRHQPDWCNLESRIQRKRNSSFPTWQDLSYSYYQYICVGHVLLLD